MQRIAHPSKTYSDSTPSVTYNYDESSSHSTTLTNTIGRQSSESTAGTYTTSAIFSYDPMGRVINNSQQAVSSYLESITYTYDLAGNMLTASVPGAGTIRNTYNGAARLSGTTTNASGPSTLISSPHYDALGQSVSQSLGNGLNESWTYNDRGWRTGYNLANGSNSVYSYSLMQAGNGNVLSSNDAVNGDWVYGYDDFNRLTSSSVTGMLYRYPQSYTYVYDRFGNRWQQNVTSGTGDASSLAFDANNHITTTGVTYDAAGNVTNDGTNSYAYDAEGRIASVNSGTATYVYDAEGNRVSTIDSARGQISFYYDLGAHVIFEGSPGGRIRMEYYVGGRHLVTYSATTVFNHPNWLGTEQYRTTTTGTSYENCVNNPFGDNMYCAGNDGDLSRVHFTGKERDSYDTSNLTNLDNFGARFYSSAMARFMRPDPDNDSALDRHDDPQSWNGYAYARNNPLLYSDPDGRDYIVCLTGGDCLHVQNLEDLQGEGVDLVFDNGTVYTPDSHGNLVAVGTYEYASPYFFAVARGTRMAAPGVNLAAAGLGIFGYVVAAPVMVAAECAAGSPSCTKGNVAMALLPELDGLKQGATLIRAARGLKAAEILEKAGGFAAATKDFDSLTGAEKTIGNVKVKELSDGTKAVLRDFSSDGRPTLEIQHPNGEVTKYRYN